MGAEPACGGGARHAELEGKGDVLGLVDQPAQAVVVYNRFARGAEVFREFDQGERSRGLLRSIRDRDGLSILAWAVMPNYSHAALRVGPVPLWRSLGWVQARFGQDYNRRHRSSGPLWQSRFKARLVENERCPG